MAPPLLSLSDIFLTWGADPILRGLELHIGESERICLIGRNGTGKSTLMKIMAGLTEADGGERKVQKGKTIAYLPQEPNAGGYETLKDYIIGGLSEDRMDEAYRADVLIDDLKINGSASPESASGGELRRAAIARTLIGEPDLLLLDEPTNHLDIHIIEWLEEYLKSWRGAMVLISHDRAFLENLTSVCLWLDRGIVRRLDAGFAKFDAWQNDLLTEEALQNKKRDKLIKEEARWSVEGISARCKRNQGRLRRLHAMRQERAEQIKQKGSVVLNMTAGEKSGKRVIEAKGLSKAYNDQTLFDEFGIRILRGDRVGIIGPNGVGKSTLLKVLTGEIAPDSGTVTHGTNLQVLTIDQKREALKDDLTVADVIADGSDWVDIAGQRKHVRSYMQDFLFDASQANTPVSALSGGERNRLLLAANFAKPSNLLILDEPTNDLDMDTLDLLQEILADYEGTILLVSHDRDFLDRIVTSSIVFEGRGRVTEYAGGYSDYKAQAKNAGEMLPTPPSEAPKKQSATVTSINKAPAKKQKKLSYKDQRELDVLPAEVETLSMQISDMEAELSDPALYSKNPERFSALSEELTVKRDLLDEKEMRWLELEELKDSLSGAPE